MLKSRINGRFALSNVDHSRWNSVVNASGASTPFHLIEWASLLNTVHGHMPVCLELDDVVFPLAFIKSRVFGNRLISLPFADYGGPLASDMTVLDDLMYQLERIAKGLAVDFIEIRAPERSTYDTLKKHGFVQKSEYLTYVLPITRDIKQLWKTIGKDNRRMVRKAETHGLRVSEATHKDDLSIFYELYLKTAKRLGSPPQPFTFFETMWELFFPQKLRLTFAMRDNEALAGELCLLHNDTIHCFNNCSAAKLTLGQNNLVLWDAIRWGSENGFQAIDIGRTRENSGGTLFKRRWGGNCVTMDYFYKFYRGRLDERQEIKYDKLSKLWGLCMPSYLAKRIGPKIIRQIG
jgi:predicted N-acyltransferase